MKVIQNFGKMNSPVTVPHMSAIVIPNFVMIHQPWVKKIPAEYVEVVQQKDFVLKIEIFLSSFAP